MNEICEKGVSGNTINKLYERYRNMDLIHVFCACVVRVLSDGVDHQYDPVTH